MTKKYKLTGKAQEVFDILSRYAPGEALKRLTLYDDLVKITYWAKDSVSDTQRRITINDLLDRIASPPDS